MKIESALLITMMLVTMVGCAGRSPELGVTDGHLTPCPNSPNCVNSQATGDSHFVAPIDYACSRDEARLRLLQILKKTRRVRIVTAEENYIRVEFTSRIFRFVDDVEFYFPKEPVIQVRSASRLGYSDMGANRRRIERIREQFSKQKGD